MEMFLQNSNNVRLMPPSMQLAAPFFIQRKDAAMMNSSEWFYQPPLLPGVSAELLNQNLWQEFNVHNTEMIITKSGRRMFPSVQINVSGLQKRESYYVLMEIAPASDRRHKYCGHQNGSKSSNMGGWSFAGPAELQHHFNKRIYTHPDSPSTGSHWMDNPISFNKLKLTNNANDQNNVVLTSMHKYVPKIWIIHCSDAKNITELFSYPATSFTFKETEFIAVTAYQNENITKLKINNNPFAKGFRKTGQSRFKRKYNQIDQVQSDSSPDEEVSLSDVSHVSERDSVVSNAGDSMQESAERLTVTVEKSTDNDARDDARPIAVNPPVPIAAVPIAANRPRSPVKAAENHHEVPFHRPWMTPPHSRHQVTPSYCNSLYCNSLNCNLHYSYHQPYHQSFPQYLYSQNAALQNYYTSRLRDYYQLCNYYYDYPRL